MRKVSLVLLALIVAAGTAFASDVTITGGVQQAWGFGDGVYSAFDGPAGDIDVDVKAVVDDVNTAYVKLEQGGISVAEDFDGDGVDDFVYSSSSDLVVIDEAYFDTNLAAAFGLEGVILQTRVGYWENDNFNVANSGYSKIEDAADTGAEDQAIQFEAGMTDLVTARFVIVPGDGDDMDGLVAIKGGYGPVMAELFYSDINGQEPGKGELGVGVSYSDTLVPETVDLFVGVDFEMDLDSDAAPAYTYGVSANAGLLGGLATVGLGFKGMEDAEAAALDFAVNVAPVAFAGLDLYVALGLEEDIYPETLEYLEVSGYLKPGAATFRLGYAYYDGAKGAGASVNDYKAGGVIGGAESGFMFLNTSISF